VRRYHCIEEWAYKAPQSPADCDIGEVSGHAHVVLTVLAVRCSSVLNAAMSVMKQCYAFALAELLGSEAWWNSNFRANVGKIVGFPSPTARASQHGNGREVLSQ